MLLASLIAQTAQPQLLQITEDTVLDKAEPVANFGRDTILKFGEGKVVLIKFPGLGLDLPAGSTIATASMRLNLVNARDLKLKRVARLLRPWREGSGRTSVMGAANAPTQQGAGASWTAPFGGRPSGNWERPGATGGHDAEAVAGAKATIDEGVLVIEGLGQAAAQMADDPSRNFGFAIEIEGRVSVISGDIPSLAPKLEYATAARSAKGSRLVGSTLRPVVPFGDSWPAAGTDSEWEYSFSNAGESTATGYDVEWSVDGRVVFSESSRQALPPGETVTVKAPVPNSATSDGRQPVLRVIAKSGTGTSDVGMDAYPGAVPVGGDSPLVARAVDLVNKVWLPQSRSSVSQEGCLVRFRFDPRAPWLSADQSDTVDSTALSIIDKWTPMSGSWFVPPDRKLASWPESPDHIDTRDDGLWPKLLPMPGFPWFDRRVDQPILERRGPLPIAQVWAMNAATHVTKSGVMPVMTLPKTIGIELTGYDGKPVSEAEVTLQRTIDGKLTMVATGTTDRSGLFRWSPLPENAGHTKTGNDSWYLVTATSNGSKATAWLPAWRPIFEHARTGTGVTFVSVGLNFVAATVDRSQDLALGRPVTDSSGRLPAELAPVADGDASTVTNFGGVDGAWFEIDLGRDRLVAEVELDMPDGCWDRFMIFGYQTGQTADLAKVWCEGQNAGFLARIEGKPGSFRFSGSPTQMRYLRFFIPSADSKSVGSVRVYPAQR